ncbi:MAG: hypothetical protein K1060chlam2_01205 [Chlamydiae bacterium]|nr:hypothetical protein [Chlamydiota bacterium]
MQWMIDIFKYALVDFMLQRKVKRRYYSDPRFSSLDRSLLKSYLFKNPYQISKRYLRRKGAEDINIYGETPLTTYEVIAKEAEIDRDDSFLELGCGRGRGALFIHHFFRCKVIALEQIPLFVRLAKKITEKYDLSELSFICCDMKEMPLTKRAVVYLYGLSLSDEEIESLVVKLKSFPKGTRVVTVSYPLTDYDERAFQIKKSFSLSFPWGETDGFLQIVK